jgi:hypothetical protein
MPPAWHTGNYVCAPSGPVRSGLARVMPRRPPAAPVIYHRPVIYHVIYQRCPCRKRAFSQGPRGQKGGGGEGKEAGWLWVPPPLSQNLQFRQLSDESPDAYPCLWVPLPWVPSTPTPPMGPSLCMGPPYGHAPLLGPSLAGVPFPSHVMGGVPHGPERLKLQARGGKGPDGGGSL